MDSVTSSAGAPTFEEYVGSAWPSLYRYAYLLTGSVDDAADLVQDALVRTFGTPRVSLTLPRAEAYVRRAILNQVIDRSRREGTWRRVRHLAAAPTSVDSPVAAADERLDLIDRVRALPPRQERHRLRPAGPHRERHGSRRLVEPGRRCADRVGGAPRRLEQPDGDVLHQHGGATRDRCGGREHRRTHVRHGRAR